MSLIPLILGDTVVEKKTDNPDNTKLVILNLDKDQLTSDSGNASYDLRIGNRYRDFREPEAETLNDDRIELKPQMAVVIETEEEVHFPPGMFGYILPKVSLLQKGISNTASKIDPGYGGKLQVTLFNLATQTINLKRGEKFCSLHVVDIREGGTIRPYNKPGKSIEGEGKGLGKVEKMLEFIKNNSVLISLGIGLIAVIIALLALFKK